MGGIACQVVGMCSLGVDYLFLCVDIYNLMFYIKFYGYLFFLNNIILYMKEKLLCFRQECFQ